jgi:preprotein translocase subunit SecA
LSEGFFPSFTLKLLINSLKDGQTGLSTDQAQTALVNLAAQSIQAEETHLIHTVDGLLENSKLSLEDQLEERLETLDMFIEGLSLSDETDTRSPQQLSQEMVEMLRLPLQISPDIMRSVIDDPYEMGGRLRELVQDAMQALTITRLIGAVERVLKTSLGLSPGDLLGKDWDQLADQILGSIQNIYNDRLKSGIGDEKNPGQIVRDLQANFSKVAEETLSEIELLNLIMMIPQGRRQAFDKKTHQRVWVGTSRLTYIHNAARALEGLSPEEITEDVLAHLENAHDAILAEWGQTELARLEGTQLSSLDQSARDGLGISLGEETFHSIQDQLVSSLDQPLQLQIAEELGRQALTKIYRELLLRVISNLWIDYLTQMEALRVAIGLEAYAQRDPLVQYKTRAFEMFQNLLRDMRMSMVTRMFTFRPANVSSIQTGVQKVEVAVPEPQKQSEEAAKPSGKKRRRRRRRK